MGIIILLILLFLAVLLLLSSIYVVRQQSVAIIERFGRYQRTSSSDMNFRLPFGIDKIATDRDRKSVV